MIEPYRISAIKTAGDAATLRDKEGNLVATTYGSDVAKLLAAAPLYKAAVDALLEWQREPSRNSLEKAVKLGEDASLEYTKAGR